MCCMDNGLAEVRRLSEGHRRMNWRRRETSGRARGGEGGLAKRGRVGASWGRLCMLGVSDVWCGVDEMEGW